MPSAGINPAVFDRALYDRASRKKSRGFDPVLYDRLLEERHAGGYPSSAAAISGSNSGAAAFAGDPSTIFGSALTHRYRSNLGVTNTSGVCTGLADQAGTAHMIPFTTGPNVLTVDSGLSSKQTLTMASGTGLYVNPITALSTPFTMVVIIRMSTWANGNVVFGNTSGIGLTTQSGTPNITQNIGAVANPSPLTFGTWQLVIAEFTGSTSDRIKVGSSAFTAIPGTSAGTTAMTLLGLNLAGGPGAGLFQFFEGFTLNRVGTAGEYTNLRSYCAAQSASIQC